VICWDEHRAKREGKGKMEGRVRDGKHQGIEDVKGNDQSNQSRARCSEVEEGGDCWNDTGAGGGTEGAEG
jgi:hypothetical protein